MEDYLQNLREKKVDALRELAKEERWLAAQILAKHGQGVRPSWVSAELAIHYERARNYDLRATQIEMGSPI